MDHAFLAVQFRGQLEHPDRYRTVPLQQVLLGQNWRKIVEDDLFVLQEDDPITALHVEPQLADHLASACILNVAEYLQGLVQTRIQGAVNRDKCDFDEVVTPVDQQDCPAQPEAARAQQVAEQGGLLVAGRGVGQVGHVQQAVELGRVGVPAPQLEDQLPGQPAALRPGQQADAQGAAAQQLGGLADQPEGLQGAADHLSQPAQEGPAAGQPLPEAGVVPPHPAQHVLQAQPDQVLLLPGQPPHQVDVLVQLDAAAAHPPAQDVLPPRQANPLLLCGLEHPDVLERALFVLAPYY